MKNDRLHKNKIRFTPHHLRYNQSKQANIILAKPDSHIWRHQILHKNRCVLDFDCHGLFTNLMLKNYEIIYFSTQFSNAIQKIIIIISWKPYLLFNMQGFFFKKIPLTPNF